MTRNRDHRIKSIVFPTVGGQTIAGELIEDLGSPELRRHLLTSVSNENCRTARNIHHYLRRRNRVIKIMRRYVGRFPRSIPEKRSPPAVTAVWPFRPFGRSDRKSRSYLESSSRERFVRC